jgi:hypothetical protein
LGLISSLSVRLYNPSSLLELIFFFWIFQKKEPGNQLRTLKKIFYFRHAKSDADLNTLESSNTKPFRIFTLIICFSPLILSIFFRPFMKSLSTGFWAPEIALLYRGLILWALAHLGNLIPETESSNLDPSC